MREKIKNSLVVLFACMAFSVTAAAQGTLITTQPEGVLKTYDRAGYAYYNNNGYLRRGAQTGTIDIVYGKDGVYLKDPLSKAIVGTWVKASISADSTTITLPLGQAIAYDATQADSVILGIMDLDEEYEEFDEDTSVKNVTFTVNGETITLNGTGRDKVLAAMWKTSREWAEYADYNTKYTLQVTADTLVTPSAGLATDTYRFSGRSYIYDRNQKYDVTVGFDGDDMYIKGIFADVPDAWIKGTKKGESYVFPHGQLLGKTHTGTTNYYMIACNHQNTSEIQDLVLNIDSTDSYSTDQYLVLNTAKNTVYLTEALDSVVIRKVINNGAYDVPFSESFDGGLNGFSVIDANGDGVTWVINPLGQDVEYNWSETNNGDDWLITPNLRLQAGKTYKFSLKARSFAASSPEKFEVKLGNAPTVEAMTTQLIDTTTVATEDKTEHTATFTVPADGIYNIGTHAVSDKGNMTLIVDDITVTDVTTDGISRVSTRKSTTDSLCYNLSGQRVGNSYKGIIIQNGRKFVRR